MSPSTQSVSTIDTTTLSSWLEANKALTILDVRPAAQREEWYIPGSIHLDVYDNLKANDTTALAGLTLAKDKPVVTVCAAGKASELAASLLQEKGYEVYSLQGGMKAWNLAWNKASLKTGNIEIIQLRRTGKGCLSYIIASDNEAVVIDASLPVEVYQEIAESNGWKLVYILDTHIHADHFSRSRELAETTRAQLILPKQKTVAFPHTSIENHEIIEFGRTSLKAIHTPGHTLESTCYLVENKFLFSGDTLFVKGIGRPDLKASEEETIRKSALLYQSLHTIVALGDEIVVLPGHTSEPVAFNRQMLQTSIGEAKENISMLGLPESAFIENILKKIPPTPANYLQIAQKNINGELGEANPLDLEAGANRCAVS